MTKCYQLARLFFHYNIKVGDNIFLISIDLARIHLFLSLHWEFLLILVIVSLKILLHELELQNVNLTNFFNKNFDQTLS